MEVEESVPRAYESGVEGLDYLLRDVVVDKFNSFME